MSVRAKLVNAQLFFCLPACLGRALMMQVQCHMATSASAGEFSSLHILSCSYALADAPPSIRSCAVCALEAIESGTDHE